MDHNPLLKHWLEPRSRVPAQGGQPERSGDVANIVWQTRPAPLSDYEERLADALIACFDEGISELAPLIERLTARGVLAPDGSPWTVAKFEAEMARLGR